MDGILKVLNELGRSIINDESINFWKNFASA